MSRAIVSYIPALHKGYLDFFRKYSGEKLFVLDKKFVLETPRLERDIRALEPEEIKTAVEALKIFSEVEVLDNEKLEDLKNLEEIILPDEDVNRNFAGKYLPGLNVQFISVFLRWDKQISTTEFVVPPDRTISQDDLDREFMAAAKKESGKSPDWWRQIGAAIVKDGKIMALKHNAVLFSEYSLNAFGDPRSNFDAGQNIELVKTIHAEANAIAEAARKGLSLEGAAMYVTTFPCPVCAKLLAVSGIKKLYYQKGYSLLDAEDVLRAFGVEIILVKD